MGSIYKHVFSPIRIRGVDFKNRIEMAPPSPNLADPDGRITPEFVECFRPIAKGGVAIIVVGNSMIDLREARNEERQLDLGRDDFILPLTPMLKCVLVMMFSLLLKSTTWTPPMASMEHLQ